MLAMFVGLGIAVGIICGIALGWFILIEIITDKYKERNGNH
jgi:uncharacterized protein YneF (UPF0154 family)